MPTPTTSVRLSQEHHQLIHDIARAIKSDPGIAESLRAVLAGRNTATQPCDTAAQPEIIDRLDAIEARLAAIEERTAMHAIHGPVAIPDVTRSNRSRGTRKRRTTLTDDLRRAVHDMYMSGHTQDAIHRALGIAKGTVSNILAGRRPD